ncbi:MAG: hypothetical protein HW411_1260 [Gammaproteobacteria bacterium]|nr:hypothetical protein [Gammaproteobacteria bacterium]
MPTPDMPNRGWATHSNRSYFSGRKKFVKIPLQKYCPKCKLWPGRSAGGNSATNNLAFPGMQDKNTFAHFKQLNNEVTARKHKSCLSKFSGYGGLDDMETINCRSIIIR